jgi:hypothetical protein
MCVVAVPLCLVGAACAPPDRRRARDLERVPSAGTLVASAETSVLPGRADGRHRQNARVFTQDALWTDIRGEYAVWVNAAGDPIVGRRGRPDGRWSTFDLSRLRGNPLAAPTEPDEHNVYVIALDRDGYVHVAGNMHASPLRYVRSVRPGDITRWTTASMIGTEESAMTYPVFVRRRDGSLLFLYRQGGSGNGDVYLNAYAGGRWTRVAKVIDGRASDESPYLFHVSVDDQDVLHLMFVWRRTGEESSNGDLSYARSPDGGTHWERANGRTVPVPITHARAEIVVNTARAGYRLSNAGGLETDSLGRPHAAMLVAAERGRRIWHVWHDGRWRRRTVTLPEPAVTRPSVVVSRSNRVYVLVSSRTAVWLVDMTNGADARVLANGRLDGWELPFDTQALYLHGTLRFLLPVTSNGNEHLAVASTELADAA